MVRLQSSSLSTLPFDLVEEILVRIPATSLQRLRSTCKQWNVLLNDQRFTKKHFDKAEKKFLVVMLRIYFTISTSLDLLGLHDNNDPSSIEIKGELSLIDPTYTYSKNADVLEVFHCNGLLLCKTATGLVVWNPCTDQTMWIELTDADFERKDTYALGHENNKSCCNYKILKFCGLETFDLEIYELNSNSWRVLGNITPDFTISQHGVSLKGNTYWIAYKDEDEESIDVFLISFDFTTETFGPRLCLPVKGYWFRDTISLSCVREERLSVFFQDDDTLKMEIWISNNINESKAMSWSQFFKIDLNTHRFGADVSFVLDEENKMMVCCDKKSSSHDHNDSVDIIGEDRYWRRVLLEGRSDWPLMFSYVPSLVQI